MRQQMVVAGFLMMAVAASAAPQITLPELAASGVANPIKKGRLRELTVPPLEEIADASDLVLEATLVPQRSYLSKNLREVYTDYVAHPIRVISARTERPTQRIPGGQPIIVTLFGGEIDIHGVKVIITDDNRLPFESGARFILFLRKARHPDASQNSFEPVGEVIGLFQIVNGRMRGMIQGKGHGKEIENFTPDQFLAKAQPRKPR